MQTAKIKSIRLFHTFCFSTYGTTHAVVGFLLLVWKKCWEKCLCELPALLFFRVRRSAQIFPQAPTLFEWPILCLARSHTALHTSANARYLLPQRINGIKTDTLEIKLFHAFKKIILSNYLGNTTFPISEYQERTSLA